ncbi:MAG: 2-succinyl-5-enolpyruvyl-6-hydroxy-3-cyclohexene-1-carboxylic-acid synthase, partial [Dehalococcoidia bacterium]
VVEAFLAHVPLVVATADRPPELRAVGAPQTIDQIRLFGSHVKASVEMATPGDADELLRYAHHWGMRAAATASAAPQGPVHCNFPFREPLIPSPPETADSTVFPAAFAEAPPPPIQHATRRPTPAQIAPLLATLAEVDRGIVVCGPQSDSRFPPLVVRLAAVLGFPILADPLSQVRCGPHDRASVIDAYDGFLRDDAVAAALLPEAVIRFGAAPVSKPLTQFIDCAAESAAVDGAPFIQILVTDGETWSDPSLRTTQAIGADASAFCQGMLALLPAEGKGELPGTSAWLRRWQACNVAARSAIADAFDADASLSEPRVAAELAGLLPDGATLFAGNSMPVREVDGFFPGDARPIRVLANRGAGGIDGIVSSALGASIAVDGPLVLLIGDLSLYHDLNGLAAIARHGLDATIVLLNNDGGGIFSFLPQADEVSEFETLFGTPHGLTFASAAALYGLDHRAVDSPADFADAVRESLNAPGVQIVEVRTERHANVAVHRDIWKRVATRCREALAECTSP